MIANKLRVWKIFKFSFICICISTRFKFQIRENEHLYHSANQSNGRGKNVRSLKFHWSRVKFVLNWADDKSFNLENQIWKWKGSKCCFPPPQVIYVHVGWHLWFQIDLMKIFNTKKIYRSLTLERSSENVLTKWKWRFLMSIKMSRSYRRILIKRKNLKLLIFPKIWKREMRKMKILKV